MGSIKILDVTLRDGGIVNNFEFGKNNIKSVINAIENAGAKYIELGYLEKTKGTTDGDRTQFKDEKIIYNTILNKKEPGVKYLAMCDYSKFDVEALEERKENSVDGIRFAFHKRNFNEALELYQAIIDKGYDVYMQPMVTLHYTEAELEELIARANKLKIKGIYFVDTFGQMMEDDIIRLTKFFDERLRPDIALGFHAHNNIQMAFANAVAFINIPTARDKMLDSSILGMGRGAGNLNTELILSYLNRTRGTSYNLKPILHIMGTIINPIRRKYSWGYSPEYFLSAVNDTSPIYSKHYTEIHKMPLTDVADILKNVEGEKRISFDKKYAEDIFVNYENNK